MDKKNRLALASLAMDLKRVALGYYRGSDVMAERFFEEIIKRRNEVDRKSVKPYIGKILDSLELMRQKNREDIAEDALMYSTLLQNASFLDKP